MEGFDGGAEGAGVEGVVGGDDVVPCEQLGEALVEAGFVGGEGVVVDFVVTQELRQLGGRGAGSGFEAGLALVGLGEGVGFVVGEVGGGARVALGSSAKIAGARVCRAWAAAGSIWAPRSSQYRMRASSSVSAEPSFSIGAGWESRR